MPTSTPTTTPTITPTVTPHESPWPERWTSPDETCPQQHRETASPDIAP